MMGHCDRTVWHCDRTLEYCGCNETRDKVMVQVTSVRGQWTIVVGLWAF